MKKYIHCAFVLHERDERKYLFSVDSPYQLKNGTEVLCETIQGEVRGICVGNSFLVDESTLKSIVVGVGAYLPLKRIVGTITEKMTTTIEVNRFDGLPF